ncbi:helix-turn-helix transcriptional regulator [Psychrobacillus sp. Sa2BUA9]|uniref:Helix-turn-helix transcriptional regulator n=1 Tax=Psychrobacillus faecigallinarum TaxID=2762235 RepID=A0ABR8RBW6_9BACI|nr:helix-turn-helix transcriptional regulator [Psychrobacillus faecigallinarum]MBD7945287.1 helix-turn-helix transcriptional regulator [Psychrobacillus faecigallinarum]
MTLTMGEKLKILLGRKEMSIKSLAEKLGQSRQNLSVKIKNDNFTEQDLRKIAEVLDVKYEGFFFLNDGEKI